MPLLNVILFFVTFLTTTAAGAFQAGVNPLSSFYAFTKGLPFSLTLMVILLFHESGHFFASKYHKVAVTPPYFIPAPSLIGTFGAFIKIKAPMPNRQVLFDIGIAGPLSGIVVCLPILIYGIAHSRVIPSPTPPQGLILGDCLLFKILVRIIWGSLPENVDLMLHPAAFAGWLGLFVTALNLMPAGQLDGGHVAFAILGERGHRLISRLTLICLIGLGFMGWYGWFVWAILLVFLGIHHPEPVDPTLPLGKGRVKVGILALFIFILTFIPVPFKI